MRAHRPLLTLVALVSSLLAGGVLAGTRVAARPRTAAQDDEALHKPLDEILDLYVRDGYVYYRALKSDRVKLDRYLASLAGGDEYETWSRERQIAFWLNAYDGVVLQSVINNYPIHGRSSAYPSDSIRQIPGVFDRVVHHLAGRSLTLDAIENTVLPAFKDPRVYFALGRGAVGSGRLRSEAFLAGKLESQLKEVAAEVASRPALFAVDQVSGQVRVSPIFGWHEAEFIAAYAGQADQRFANRSPMERAIVAFAMPNLLPEEVEFLNGNTFQVTYLTFDWHLDDLASRR